MDFITNLLPSLPSLPAINLEPIFQIFFVALIMLAGPAVIFLLAFQGGDL